jgi:hypothetical protein
MVPTRSGAEMPATHAVCNCRALYSSRVSLPRYVCMRCHSSIPRGAATIRYPRLLVGLGSLKAAQAAQ